MNLETLSPQPEWEKMPDRTSTEDEVKLAMLLEQRGTMAAELAQNPPAHELKVQWLQLLDALIATLEIKLTSRTPGKRSSSRG